jgi:hypothetical protein
VKSLKEIKSLFRPLDYIVQGLDRILRTINLFILSGQSLEGIPDVEFRFGLKGGGEFFEKALYPVFFVRQDINNGGLGKNEFLQVLKDLLFFRGFFHWFVSIIQELFFNVNLNKSLLLLLKGGRGRIVQNAVVQNA